MIDESNLRISDGCSVTHERGDKVCMVCLRVAPHYKIHAAVAKKLMTGPPQEGEIEIVEDEFYDSPILRSSVYKTSHFKNQPVIALSLFNHDAVNEAGDIRTAYLTEEILLKYLAALRRHKESISMGCFSPNPVGTLKDKP